MAGGLKTKYKIALAAIGVVGLLAGAKCAFDSGLIPKPASVQSIIPDRVEIPQGDVVQGAPRASYELPITPAANFTGCANVLSIPWNGTSALNLANGGPRTTRDSLVQRYSGGCLNIERQDDYAVMREQMARFAAASQNGGTPSEGAAFTIIMGDALPSYMAALQPMLARYSQSAVVVGVVGFSYGEDKCMGKPLNGNPQNARGSLIAAVRMDGDQNTCIKFADDNNIPVNIDQTTYDRQAINFLDASSFVEAGEKYLTNFCEERNEVSGGIATGRRVRVCVDGVATWTPGDVTVAQRIAQEQRAGRGPAGEPRQIVSWASTREYNQQMPTVLIANKQWAERNRAFVVGLLRAADRAAFDIRTPGSRGLQRASAINANIFGQGGGEESDPAYWARYFVGEDFTDARGNHIRLGGSRVITLAEARDFLGLRQGTLNVYEGVYNTFCRVYTTFYPRDLSECPAYNTVVDTSYVTAALQGVETGATGPRFEQGSITETVSQRAFSINFETGSATISRSSYDTLRQIAEQSGMTGLRIRIDGHTDMTGNPDANMALSRARAQAVADWLHNYAPETFPRERITARGYGDSMPKCEERTPACYAQNRRVEIVLGN